MQIPEKIGKMSHFLVMEILERAIEYEKKGERVIHLEVGEPDFPTPEPIKEAAIRAMKEGKTGYTHSLGILELREAIAENYHRNYGVTVSPDQIVVTSGTSPAMLLVFTLLLNRGDEVILSDPHYACYPNFIYSSDGVPVYVNTDEKDGYKLRPERIDEAISEKTKAILINSPANPTGIILGEETLKEIAQKGPYIISDEIYHGLTYGEKAHSILEYTDEAFVLNGFSKLYAMTGWRLGYLISPPRFMRDIQKLQQNFYISANAFVQWAGVEALTNPDCQREAEKMVQTYNRRREYIIPRLREMGFRISHDPTGAYYVLADASDFSGDSLAFAYEILDKAYVAVTPGVDFGDNGEGCLRFSYANSIESIQEGLGRIDKYLNNR